MTVEELYDNVNGSYRNVMQRIPTEELVIHFLKKFLLDSSYEELICAVDKKDVLGSFEASHKLKGVVANMGFTDLYDAVYQLTEHLRSKPSSIDLALVNKVSDCYNTVIKGIKDFENEND